MKTVIGLIAGLVLALAAQAWACGGSCGSSCGSCGSSCSCGMRNNAPQEMQKVKEKIQLIDVGNKICPVSGEKVGAMGKGVKIEHAGKMYNLCCSGCEAKFKSDPQKYIEIIKKELTSK